MEPILDIVDILGIIVDIILELVDIVIISALVVMQEPNPQVIKIRIYLNKKKVTQIKIRRKILTYLMENQIQILNKIQLYMLILIARPIIL